MWTLCNCNQTSAKKLVWGQIIVFCWFAKYFFLSFVSSWLRFKICLVGKSPIGTTIRRYLAPKLSVLCTCRTKSQPPFAWRHLQMIFKCSWLIFNSRFRQFLKCITALRKVVKTRLVLNLFCGANWTYMLCCMKVCNLWVLQMITTTTFSIN